MIKFVSLLACFACFSLAGCATTGGTSSTIPTDVIDGLSALHAAAAAAQVTGAIPPGKASDAVADASTISNGLLTLASGQPITAAQGLAIAQSLKANAKTTAYIEIGTQVINGLVAITNAMIERNESTATVQAAQVQYLNNAPVAEQAGLTPVVPTAAN